VPSAQGDHPLVRGVLARLVSPGRRAWVRAGHPRHL